MAKTKTSLSKVTFIVPVGGPSSADEASNTYTTKDDVQDMIDNYAHLTAEDVQELIDATLSKIARAEDTEY